DWEGVRGTEPDGEIAMVDGDDRNPGAPERADRSEAVHPANLADDRGDELALTHVLRGGGRMVRLDPQEGRRAEGPAVLRRRAHRPDSRSELTDPDASQSAACRYVARRLSGKNHPRSRSPARNSNRARSASCIPL